MTRFTFTGTTLIMIMMYTFNKSFCRLRPPSSSIGLNRTSSRS